MKIMIHNVKGTNMSQNNLMPPIGFNEASEGTARKTIGSFFGKLFEARDFAHHAHLQTKSYSQHKALGSFYESIVDLADTFFEVHAGQYGITKFNMSAAPSNTDVIAYFENLAKTVANTHNVVDKKDTHLHNILDEITAEVYHLLYKLKNLK